MRSAAQPGLESREEFFGDFSGDAVDEPRAHLSDLAADLGIGRIGELSSGLCIGRKVDVREALAKPRGAAGAFESQRVALGRDDIGQQQFAGEAGFYRADDGQHAALIGSVESLLNSPQVGGLSGLIDSFEQQGLGGTIRSWIGTGANQSITPEQIQSVLGNEQVQALAQKLGFSPETLSSHLSQILPEVIDRLTPGGTVPEGGLVGGLLGLLKGAAPDAPAS